MVEHLAAVTVPGLLGVVVGASTQDPILGAAVSYGVAAPLVYFMFRRVQQAEKERDVERGKVEALTDRLLEQQAASLPVLTEAVAVIRASTADRR